MARSDYVKHQFRLPRALSERLDTLASAPGVTKSKILVEAVAAFLERGGHDELELRFAQRLDRLSNHLARIERNTRVELESLGLFIRYMLTVSPPIGEGDEAARAVGRDRFAAFVERVGRSLAGGKLSLLPGDDR